MLCFRQVTALKLSATSLPDPAAAAGSGSLFKLLHSRGGLASSFLRLVSELLLEKLLQVLGLSSLIKSSHRPPDFLLIEDQILLLLEGPSSGLASSEQAWVPGPWVFVIVKVFVVVKIFSY